MPPMASSPNPPDGNNQVALIARKQQLVDERLVTGGLSVCIEIN